jgi:pimeloyl-ACP methyl ester carboxylesterase
MATIASATRREFINREGMRLIADEFGPQDGPVVLFLHGGGQTRASWGRAIEQLGQAGYRAITVDHRGHGESDWSPGGTYENSCFVNDLSDILHELPASAALVGASLGGVAALLAVASGMDNGARALVLVDVVPRLDPEGSREILNFMASNPQGFASVEEAADSVSAYLPHRPRPKDTSGLKRNLRQREDGRFYWHWDPQMIRKEMPDWDEITQTLEEAARKVRIPTLLIRGAKSRLVSPEAAGELLHLIPQAEFVDIVDAHHMVAGDANDAFAAPLLDFLGRTMPA